MQMVVPADPKVISVRSAGVPGQPFASMKPSKARAQQANLRAPKRPKMKRAIVVCLGLLAPVCPAAADSPVAVVEEIQGKVTGAEFMDYVTPKSVIKIEGGGAIVLSYLKSCRRETISGAGHRDRRHRGEQRPSRRSQGGADELRYQPDARDLARHQRCRRHVAARRRVEQRPSAAAATDSPSTAPRRSWRPKAAAR